MFVNFYNFLYCIRCGRIIFFFLETTHYTKQKCSDIASLIVGIGALCRIANCRSPGMVCELRCPFYIPVVWFKGVFVDFQHISRSHGFVETSRLFLIVSDKRVNYHLCIKLLTNHSLSTSSFRKRSCFIWSSVIYILLTMAIIRIQCLYRVLDYCIIYFIWQSLI